MFNFKKFLTLLICIFVASCVSSANLINSNSIYKGMEVQEFRRTMFYGVNSYEDPWTGQGSEYNHEYRGYHLVYGSNPDEIVFIFDKENLLIDWVSTISLAEKLVDKKINEVLTNKNITNHNNTSNYQGWLGVHVQEITPEISSAYSFNQSVGSFVSSVVDDSPAQMAGLKAGDVIVSLNGNIIENWNDLPLIVETSPIGRQLEIVVFRDNGLLRLPVTLMSGNNIEDFSKSNLIPKEVDNQNSAKLSSNKKSFKYIENSNLVDDEPPLLSIVRADTVNKQGVINGRVRDNVGIAEVTVDSNIVSVTSNGSFEYSTYIPVTGLTLVVEVTDLSGLSSSKTITLERNVNLETTSILFDELNPLSHSSKSNKNALAIIIGISNYKNTPAKAIFADSDAMIFRDYASEKLGIPENRIKTLINDGADETEMLLAVQTWLSRSVKQDQTDVYVFFAGHGLASDDGQNMYLLPYDGSPELLDRTAILRDELFSDIASANPRSVTVFLDTCYSGSTRGSEMLIAARPILLKAKESAVPEGFTVFTAAAGDETAKPLEEAKHGMFSYFLMKGMEGDADTNGDKQITAGELHAYVKSNVIQQSNGTQTPELQGDENRVLVRFQ